MKSDVRVLKGQSACSRNDYYVAFSAGDQLGVLSDHFEILPCISARPYRFLPSHIHC